MTPTYIIVHCSDSTRGSASDIEIWHKARGFKSIGYHFVVLNGNPGPSGMVQRGRPENKMGAHTLGFNNDSLGVCLIGRKGHFDAVQLRSAVALVTGLCRKHGIPVENVLGHYETENGRSQGKTCPDLDMDDFRRKVAARMEE